MKKAVYTAIIGEYDRAVDPIVYNKNWDYFLFTDRPDLHTGLECWKVIPVKSKYDVTRSARNIKITGYMRKPLSSYDVSVWVDANIIQQCDMDDLYDRYKSDLSIMKHPSRVCAYDEATVCIGCGKADKETTVKQMKRYRDEGYPFASGMVASGIMIRKHGVKEVDKLMRAWWKEVKNGSKRDQLSFNYVCWKHGYDPKLLPYDTIHKQFKYIRHLKHWK